jgi:cell shape-determining protein MreC
MSSIKFQHVFVALMLLSLVSAFAIPPKYTTRLQPQVQGLFAPVARPARAVAGWTQQRLFPDKSNDQRAAADVRDENESLRGEVARLERLVGLLEERKAERERLGPVGERCRRIAVVGSDAGTRQSLALRGSTLDGVRDGMEVLYAYGIVGKVERAGVAGAQVRLVTDMASKQLGRFGTFGKRADGGMEFVPLATPPVLVEGRGDGTMIVRSLTLEDVRRAGLRADHSYWVVLEDRDDWSDDVQGLRLGGVTNIAPRRDAPLHADIRVEPAANLSRLREVMIVTRAEK